MKYYPIPSFPEYLISKSGAIWSKITNRRLSPFVDVHGYGYIRVGILQCGKQRVMGVHRLLALTFIPGGSPGLQINHKNGVKTDNRLNNLEWCTPAQNSQHAILYGLTKSVIGVEHYYSKLTPDKVRAIRRHLRSKSQSEVGRMFGVSRGCIQCIHNRSTWAHVK